MGATFVYGNFGTSSSVLSSEKRCQVSLSLAFYLFFLSLSLSNSSGFSPLASHHCLVSCELMIFSIGLFIHLSIYILISLTIYLHSSIFIYPIYQSIYLSTSTSIYQSVYPRYHVLYLPPCLSVYRHWQEKQTTFRNAMIRIFFSLSHFPSYLQPLLCISINIYLCMREFLCIFRDI